MKTAASTLALIAIATQWSGCTSPKTNTSENLPSQIPSTPLELHTSPTPQTGELAGAPGIEGLPGHPVREGIVSPGQAYPLPDIDFANLQDTPAEERTIDPPRVRDPEDWKPENIATPPGSSGQPGEPEKIVILENAEQEIPVAIAANPESSEAVDSPPASVDLALDLEDSDLLYRIPEAGEASAIPVFFPSDPRELTLSHILKWLDHQQISHPVDFPDPLAALQWLKQHRDAQPDVLGDRTKQVDKLFAWLASGSEGQDDPSSNPPEYLAQSPWNFGHSDRKNQSEKREPLLMSKASLWLHNPALHQGTMPDKSSIPSNSFSYPSVSPTPASVAPVAQNSQPTLDYSATLLWLQLASHNQPAFNDSFSSRFRNAPPSRDHTEALRWIQKASGNQKAPLHASILSSGVTNP